MRICPNCESEDVEPEVADFSGFLHGSVDKWECSNCGYIGLMPEKQTEKNDKVEEEKEDSGNPSTLQKTMVVSFSLLLGLIIYLFV